MRAQKLLISVFIAAISALSADTSSLDERVAFKKLAAYWQEKDYETARESTEAFLAKYPASGESSPLLTLLGDLCFSERKYEEAACFYEQISEKAYKRKTAFHYLHSLYQSGRYDDLIAQADTFLNDPTAAQDEVNTLLFELAETYFYKEDYAKALTFYEQLNKTSFRDLSLIPLAKSYAACGQHAQAATLYLALSKSHPDKAEELLFQAACLQMEENAPGALITLNQIVDLQGKYRDKASYNILAILFQQGQYREFSEEALKLTAFVPDNKQPLVRYCLGRSLLELGSFAEAALAFQSLSDEKALTALVSCAKHLEDLKLCTEAVEKLTALAANPDTLIYALLVQLDLSKKNGAYDVAVSSIDAILTLSAEHPEKEALLYDKTILLTQAGKQKEAVCAIELFLNAYPHSAHTKRALTNLVALSSADTLQRIAALRRALDSHSLFLSEENKAHRFLLSKTLVDLERYEEALELLNDYVRDFHTHAEAHLLLAACYQDRDDRHFIDACEMALSLDPQLHQRDTLHKLLFNAYLRCAHSAASDEKPLLMAHGANHLFSLPPEAVSKENQRWLASYYLAESPHADKALIVLERLIDAETTTQGYTTDIEAEVIQLASLYNSLQEWQKACEILEELVTAQGRAPSLKWRYHRRAEFELAGVYVLLGHHEKAIEIYEHLISSSSHVASYFALAAKLQLVKLQIARLSVEELNGEAPRAKALCDQLKEIEVNWQPCSEPLHLEAGLAYIALKTQMAPPEQKKERASSLLQNLKESILTQTQNLSRIQDYLNHIDVKDETQESLSSQLRELLESAAGDTLQMRFIEDMQRLGQPL